MSIFSRLSPNLVWVQYPEYNSNIVDYSLKLRKTVWEKNVSMDVNNKRKKYFMVDRETGSDRIFALLDEGTEFVLKENLQNELDSNHELLN